MRGNRIVRMKFCTTTIVAIAVDADASSSSSSCQSSTRVSVPMCCTGSSGTITSNIINSTTTSTKHTIKKTSATTTTTTTTTANIRSLTLHSSNCWKDIFYHGGAIVGAPAPFDSSISLSFTNQLILVLPLSPFCSRLGPKLTYSNARIREPKK